MKRALITLSLFALCGRAIFLRTERKVTPVSPNTPPFPAVQSALLPATPAPAPAPTAAHQEPPKFNPPMEATFADGPPPSEAAPVEPAATPAVELTPPLLRNLAALWKTQTAALTGSSPQVIVAAQEEFRHLHATELTAYQHKFGAPFALPIGPAAVPFGPPGSDPAAGAPPGGQPAQIAHFVQQRQGLQQARAAAAPLKTPAPTSS